MLPKERKYIKDLKTDRRKAMDFASLRAKLDNIAEELAQLPEQETVAIEEEQVDELEQPVEEVEEGSRKDDEEHELEKLIKGSPIDIDASGPMKPKKMKEEEVEEATVEIPVQELADIMQLAGYANYAERIEEFANTPDGAQGEPAYMDAEDQLVGLSGGLNGPKTMHPPAADGDNPMDTEPREVEETMEAVEDKLYKSYQAFLEEEEIKVETE